MSKQKGGKMEALKVIKVDNVTMARSLLHFIMECCKCDSCAQQAKQIYALLSSPSPAAPLESEWKRAVKFCEEHIAKRDDDGCSCELHRVLNSQVRQAALGSGRVLRDILTVWTIEEAHRLANSALASETPASSTVHAICDRLEKVASQCEAAGHSSRGKMLRALADEFAVNYLTEAPALPLRDEQPDRHANYQLRELIFRVRAGSTVDIIDLETALQLEKWLDASALAASEPGRETK
jgi:hypothetical protein